MTFQEFLAVFRDELAISVEDDSSELDEQRFVAIGTGVTGRVLVVVYAYRDESIRVISARVAERQERRIYEEMR